MLKLRIEQKKLSRGCRFCGFGRHGPIEISLSDLSKEQQSSLESFTARAKQQWQLGVLFSN